MKQVYFIKLFPNNTLTLKDEMCTSDKLRKHIVIVMIAANMESEKL